MGGTPGARAAAKAAAKAKAKAQAKTAAATRRRDAYVFAHASIYGAPPKQRERVEAADVVDAAFPDELQAGLERVIAEGPPSLPAEMRCLVEVPAPANPPPAVVPDSEDRRWLQCAQCSEWRVSPEGQFQTFQRGEVKFYCRLSGAKCQNNKRHHRV